MKRIAIVAALEGELKPLVRCGFTKMPSGQKTVRLWRHEREGVEWIAACAGMGAEAARRAFAAAEAGGKFDLVISYGWAGALEERADASHAHMPTVVVDAQTGEQFRTAARVGDCRLVTTARVADRAEKARLRAAYGAQLVDMEAATVARLAAMRGIPIMCVKGISDVFGEDLPDFNRWIDAMGQMRIGSLLAHIAIRPHYWLTLIHLGKNGARSAGAMRDLILKLMSENNVDKMLRGGSE